MKASNASERSPEATRSSVRTIPLPCEGLHGWTPERVKLVTDALTRVLDLDDPGAPPKFAHALPLAQRYALLDLFNDLYDLGRALGVTSVTPEEPELTTTRRLEEVGGRVETGPVRLGSRDWAGYFFRGDEAFGRVVLTGATTLRMWKADDPETIRLGQQQAFALLRSLVLDLNRCNENAELRDEIAADVEGL